MRSAVAAVTIGTALLLGCGRGEKHAGTEDGLAKRAGTKVGETLTDFASGVGAGVDTKLVVPVELAPELLEKGLSRTVAKSLGVGVSDKGISVYIVAARPFTGQLLAKALDKENQEIGRAQAKVELGADDAKYVTFTFDSQMDANLVARYSIRSSGK